MKTRQTIIAASIAALLLSGNALAKENREFHEQLWDQIKSYGDVLLAEDSVGNWGPWADFVEPAAGAPSPALLPGAGGSDPYKNIPNTIVPNTVTETGCAAGSWCGYSIFTQSESGNITPSLLESKVARKQTQFSGGLFALTLTPPDAIQGEGNVSWRLTSLGTNTEVANSGGDMWANFGGGDMSPEVWADRWVLKKINGWWQFVKESYLKYGPGDQWNNFDNGLAHFSTNEESSDFINGFSNNSKANEATSVIDPTFFRSPFTNALKAKDEQVAVGEYQRTVWAYTTGQDKELYVYDSGPSSTTTHGFYVAGVATPQAYLDAQKAGDVVANYLGGSFDGNRQGVVAISVSFKPATWQGVWLGGLDKEAMNYTASGTVVGATISTTQNGVSAIGGNTSELSYSGSVQGTFYGQTAGSIGGISSVTKTIGSGSPPPTVAAMPTTTQTQNAVFLVNKVASGSPK
jgi:hypothetical protein